MAMGLAMASAPSATIAGPFALGYLSYRTLVETQNDIIAQKEHS